MKLIFLDIDGPMTTRWSYSHAKMSEELGHMYIPFDLNSVNALNTIIQKTGAKIVISSSWRHLHSLDELKVLVKNESVIGDVIDVTPILHIDRGLEIRQYLETYKNSEIESFVILDDDVSDILPYFPGNLVVSKYGLQAEHIEESIKILNGITNGRAIVSTIS